MKKAKLAASLIAVSMAATTLLTGCNPSEPSNSNSGTGSNNSGDSSDSTTGSDSGSSQPAAEPLTYADNTVLRMGTGYNAAKTGISFVADLLDKDTGNITLANGQTYQAGDLKPTWQELEKRLKIKFNDVYQGNKAADEFNYWKERFSEVDVVSGTAALLTEYGNAGSLVDLSQYLDRMPNFKAYLDANPIVRLSIIGSTTGANEGAIYFSPYFDGVNDIERMPLMRTDWVEKLLNGDTDFTAEKSGTTATPTYQPYMPTSGKVEVDIVKASGDGTEKLTKDYDAAGGNIISLMNAKGQMNGVDAVNMLRKYIDDAYGGHYGTNRADLFIGQDAAWDADELVALLRCVVANSQTLNGTDKVAGLFARNGDQNQRRVDLYRFSGSLFGARGLESRQDYLYVGNDNKLHDARIEEPTYEAIERMHDMALEGLISTDYMTTSAVSSTQQIQTDGGFMSYDYNQTQTIFNEQKDENGNPIMDEDEMYRAVMVPVAHWYDGSNPDGVYMRFTESWRSVKTDGWGISVEGVGSDENKLNAALTLIDYAYSKEGQILMSYGPDEFIATDESGKYKTFNFNGEDWPMIADATRTELWDRAGGNYTNYARFYLGSTLSFLKSQAFEYQCTTEAGRLGAGYISTAIALGTIKHPELALASNAWYTSVPTVLPLTTDETTEINGYTELGGGGKFGQSNKQQNLFVDMIVNGYSGEGTSSREETINTIKTTWHADTVLGIRDEAWAYLVDFYNS